MMPLRGLPLTARQKARVLSRKGRAGSLLLRYDQACMLLAAARIRVRPMFLSLPPKGDGAPKSANLLVSAILRDRGGRLSARHMRSSIVCAQVGQRPIAHR
jgi:hypothetical protein